MKIRFAHIGDYEEITRMYYELMKVCFPHRKLGPMIFFYDQVKNWFWDRKDIRVVEKDGKLIAFSLAYVDNINHTTEDVYNADIVYIDPEYRSSRCGYIIWDTLVLAAKEKGIGMTTLATPEASKITLKRYNSKLTFVSIEAAAEDIQKYKE